MVRIRQHHSCPKRLEEKMLHIWKITERKKATPFMVYSEEEEDIFIVENLVGFFYEWKYGHFMNKV